MTVDRALANLSIEKKRELLRQLLRERAEQAARWRPLSKGQQALWFVYRLAPTSPAYNFRYVARAAGRVDRSALRQACARLARRHAMLRTTFALHNDQPMQCLHEQGKIELTPIDGLAWTDDELQHRLATEADQPFDLFHGPTLRIQIVQRPDGRDVLQMVVHHLVADLWSMDILLRELGEFYMGEVAGRPVDLPPPRVDYSEFVRWQTAMLDGPRGQQHWEYWRDKLAGPLAPLTLPTDRPYPQTPSYRGASLVWRLRPELTAGVAALARQEGTTLFTTLLALFEVLLHRFSGQDDLVIGTATAGRTAAEWEPIVGYFLNQTPLRFDLSGNPPFRAVLGRTRAEVLDALEHEDFPLQQMVERLRPARHPSRSPIFQVMFIWNKPRALGDARDASELRLERIVMEQRGAPFELTFIVMEFGDRLELTLKYNADLFEPGTIERLRGGFERLLEAAVNDHDTRVLDLPLLTETERAFLLGGATSNATPFPDAVAFHQLVEKQARAAPHAVAAQSDAGQLTYAELNRRANRLAHRLAARGVGADDIVALLLDRSPELLVAILAVWKAGAAYLPVDPAYPEARRAFMLTDSQARLLIVPDREAVATLLLPADLALIDLATESLTGESDDDPEPRAGPDNLAYVIYTSGSTGTPKCVMLNHRGLCNLSEAQRQAFAVNATDRILLFSSLSFDASVFEIAMALRAGATLYIGAAQGLLMGVALFEQLQRHAITTITLPPSILATVPPGELPALKRLIVAGEACPAELVTRWGEGRRFFNAYGPTETTVWATLEECRPDGQPPTIGLPIANAQVHVLDSRLQPAPIGAPGELCIGGPGVARGYLGRPELTAERFVASPFSTDPKVRLYRTGDRARRRADGRIEFLGRLDEQVKVRGFRIEPGEIEAALRQLPTVSDAAVVARPDARGQNQLTAYVVPAADSHPTVTELAAALRARVPAHMVPSRWLTLDALPMSPSGKLDRNALPSPDRSRPELAAEFVPPRTATEELLADIWSKVLEVERVGVHDNFFELGGASLDTLQVVEKAENAGCNLSAELLLRHQTISGLAAAVDAAEPVAPRATRKESPASAPASSPTARAADATTTATPTTRMAFESIGVYLPQRRVSTADVLAGCDFAITFPLEEMTGIRERPVAADGEFSIDLARRAVEECLRRSRRRPAEIDLVICCNISRFDGPQFRVSYEPTTAVRLKREYRFDNALCFDVSNACAGFFTALWLAEGMLRGGAIRRALIVSGEYITHLTQTAQREIRDFLDPRIPCLTLGDSGVAAIVEASRDATGFEMLDLYTAGRYADLCVAKATSHPHGGAIMITDAVKSTAVTVNQSVAHALRSLDRARWSPDRVDHVIMHQTSKTTIDGAVRALNRAFGREFCHAGNTINNLARRGNSSSNSILVALADHIDSGRIADTQQLVFAVSGSGQVIGTGLYALDDLPTRMRGVNGRAHPERAAGGAERAFLRRLPRPVRIASIGLARPPAGEPADAIRLAADAAERCLAESRIDRRNVSLLLHVGTYRNEFLSEPALAAIIAGRLDLNADPRGPDAPHTLAIDLMNGGCGFLTACLTASETLAARAQSTALITASEIEHNAAIGADWRLGIAETGSAALLVPSNQGEGGFEAFSIRTFTEHQEKRAVYTVPHHGRPALQLDRDPHLDEVYLDCIATAVAEFLESQDLAVADIDLLLPPQSSPAFARAVAERLRVPIAKTVVAAGDDGDLFTSGQPFALKTVLARPAATAGGLALLIEVGAGLTVACALYRLGAAIA